MTQLTLLEKIPTAYLPDNWKEIGAKEFKCSENKIERIVYGLDKNTLKNVKIWDFMLSLAEAGKADAARTEQNLKQRLAALNS